jgi:long-chain acyl-CoA synthetase
VATDPILEPFSRLASAHSQSPLAIGRHHVVTVGEIDALATRIADRWAEDSLPGGAIVGLQAPNGPSFLPAWVGTRRAGLVPVLIDATAPSAEARRIATELGACALVMGATGWPPDLAAWSWLDFATEPRIAPEDSACIKLTSGSSGQAQGVLVSSEALAADDEALCRAMELTSQERLLAAIPLSHSYGLSVLCLPALRRGTPLVFPGNPLADELLGVAQLTGATGFPTVPAYLVALLALRDPPAWPASLTRVVCAGAPLSPEAATAFRRRFGRPIHAFYGTSETGGICYDSTGEAAEAGRVGSVIAGVEVTLGFDPDRDMTGGGVVEVTSPAVATSYWPHPDTRLSGGRFVSADLAVWEGDELRLVGRRDTRVHIRGFKVDPREIEIVLDALAGVRESVVVGVPAAGPDREPLLRAIVACDENGPSGERIAAWCRTHLAPHKVPRSIVRVPAIPRTSRGKIDRSALETVPCWKASD